MLLDDNQNKSQSISVIKFSLSLDSKNYSKHLSPSTRYTTVKQHEVSTNPDRTLFSPPLPSPWLSCCDNNWVCGLKSNMVSKLIKHRKKREPGQSTKKLTACLLQALRAQNSLSQACLEILSFWDTDSIHKEGPEKN